ncbi:MAG: RND family transporter [Chloroflexi bacterium]|mgnify:CR=1 FL=1|jgi:uncharacterized protein|nr:RND family transporter [Chloroflexota bacterium]
MDLTNMPGNLAIFVERRSILLIIIGVIITALLAPGVLFLETETGFDTMLRPGSVIFDDSKEYEEQFGAETTIVLIKASVEDVFTSENLKIIQEFEQQFLADERIQSIISPVTVLELASLEAIKQGANLEFDDPLLIKGVLEDDRSREQMDPLLPDDNHVMVSVRPVGDLSFEDSLQVVLDMEEFFRDPEHQLENVNDTRVIGEVEMIEEISKSISDNLTWLLGLSMGVMAVILILMFRVRWNLLSLFMVGIAALWTFGMMGYIGVDLSMTSMAVLPVLIGIGIDYSIQFHNRYQEEVLRRKSVRKSIIASVTYMFPTVAIALVATVIGFITLFISEVPMVQDFGKILAVGVITSFFIALFLLHSIVHTVDKRLPAQKLGETSRSATLLFERLLSTGARISLKYPIPILLIAVLLGIAGGIADRWLPSKVDHEEMMPQNSDTLKDIRYLRDITGYEGELRFMVKAEDVTSPDFLKWMKVFQDQMVIDFSDRTAIAMVYSPASIVGGKHDGIIPDEQSEIDASFENTLGVYVDQLISSDKMIASLSFGIMHMPVEDIQEMKEHIMKNANPPDGVNIAPVGNMAMGAAAVEAMVGKRVLMNGLCMAAIFVILLMVYRRFTRALFTMIPVGIVIGWTSLCLYLVDVPLNTMSAVLGVLVIGIGTEFIVLLLGRYEEERKHRDETPHDAMVIAISKTGRAIVTTALTTLGGFGVLIVSNFVMVRDFGIATTFSVVLCLISSMVVMPPLVVWWDTRIAHRLPDNL